jgi:hypothetical protein
MKTEFAVYNGDIKFMGDQIIISDGIFSWHKKLRTAYAIAAILIGGFFVSIRYFTSHHAYVIFVGLALIVIGIILLITGSKVTTDPEFDLKKVEKAVISQDTASYLNLIIYHKNSQKRKVALDYKDEDQFKKSQLSELIETLKIYSIDTEVK